MVEELDNDRKARFVNLATLEFLKRGEEEWVYFSHGNSVNFILIFLIHFSHSFYVDRDCSLWCEAFWGKGILLLT